MRHATPVSGRRLNTRSPLGGTTAVCSAAAAEVFKVSSPPYTESERSVHVAGPSTHATCPPSYSAAASSASLPPTSSPSLRATSNGPPPPSCRAPEIHLVDPSPDLFHITASGLAGGFLAKDWFAPPVAPLGAFSFDLHRKLADAAGGKAKWGWCETEGWTLDFAMEAGNHVDLNWLMSGSSRATLLAEQSLIHEEAGTHPKWVRAGASAFHPITDRQSTAQVDPMRLCEFLLSECLARGVKLHSPARATQILPDSKIRIEYLSTASPSHPHPHSQTEAKTLDIDCDTLILTAGAWTPAVYSTLFPKARHVPRVNPLAGYSILVKTPHWAPIDPANDGEKRAGGEVWFGGLNAKGLALPDVPTPIRLPSPASSSTTPTDAGEGDRDTQRHRAESM
ncbi:hypothetical protein EUX98_g4520 [Antrodiella citrinella]|uniref:FAD dependent oxidoreductase domain-containing protein n=1 Tax=Antrodiella citrinella TaxID=2447956 RepID=A0A4S4MTS0_9APHY|nr:hypothetical protein EUX98_g4520 [Antrodiella citrinella]